MDMTRYEKIDGREALKRLLAGERVLDGSNRRYLLNWTNLVVRRESGAYETVNDGLKQILETEWYIPKPFDVRQAMRDKPDEWVAAFKTSENDWVKVGFDTSEFTVVGLELSNDAPLNAAHDYFKVCVYGTDLDACIPLDEVPADAR